ncbi:unnamed protein product [Mycena citricolor]|uniref:Uncharacterized protein n=1 Tax=Mycena citricolor TaxID=2018698 RepID=A0AAD2HFH7_9AGAR|nr:unnamed protein product [Mycena citricolor]
MYSLQNHGSLYDFSFTTTSTLFHRSNLDIILRCLAPCGYSGSSTAPALDGQLQSIDTACHKCHTVLSRQFVHITLHRLRLPHSPNRYRVIPSTFPPSSNSTDWSPRLVVRTGGLFSSDHYQTISLKVL